MKDRAATYVDRIQNIMSEACEDMGLSQEEVQEIFMGVIGACTAALSYASGKMTEDEFREMVGGDRKPQSQGWGQKADPKLKC